MDVGQENAVDGVLEQVLDEEERGGRRNGRRGRSRRGEGGFRLTGSVAAKIVAFFVMVLSCLAGVWALIACFYIGEDGFYVEDLESVLAYELGNPARSTIYQVAHHLRRGDVESAELLCRDSNADIEIIKVEEDGSQEVLWSTWNGYDTDYTEETYYGFGEFDSPVTLGGYMLQEDEQYLFKAYIDPQFPRDDQFRKLAGLVTYIYEIRYGLIGMAAGGIVLGIVCFLFLMCAAGHRNGQESIVPGVLGDVHFDVLTIMFGAVLAVVGYISLEIASGMGDVGCWVTLSCAGAFAAVWMTIYCMEFANRLKRGGCFRYSLIYVILRGTGRVCRFLWKGFSAMVRAVPLVLTTVIVYLGIFILELMGVSLFVRDELGVFLWAVEKVVLFVVVLYIAQTCKKLLKAGRALAEGQGEYKVDTSRMIGDFKVHGENLNSLGQGIAKAVAERMKSERLKTELISNVSHDLKTPLTSIINYADLICEESMDAAAYHALTTEPAGGTGNADRKDGDGQNRLNPAADQAKIVEYAQVLLRQSRRLKKLLEDLMEASKATTGNLEVNLEPCEAGVLLTQAVGEYQQRMEEKGLELIARQSAETALIMADGRRLWRVFDNLLNNICKYAQENSRVYLSVEEREGDVLIVFRNMSKYPLDISAEELEERFVRGDRSRHMEGNGLGLSIAKSLVELQNGEMEITIDGDLFKVLLRFVAI